jgi:hypothetical protein
VQQAGWLVEWLEAGRAVLQRRATNRPTPNGVSSDLDGLGSPSQIPSNQINALAVQRSPHTLWAVTRNT